MIKKSFNKFLGVVHLVVIISFSSVAFADAPDGTVSWTHTTLGNDVKVTKIEGTTTKMQFELNSNTSIVCGVNGGSIYFLDFETHAIGNQIYSLLLAASVAQKKVDIYYKCENQMAKIQHAIVVP